MNPFRSYVFATYPFRSYSLAGSFVIPVGDLFEFDVTILMRLLVHAYCVMTGAFAVAALMRMDIPVDIRCVMNEPVSITTLLKYNVVKLEG